MNARVLVAYGTKNGSTAEIADVIADALKEAGLRSETRPAAAARDVTEYDAVVLGGALYAGRWHRDAVRFARRHEHSLAERPCGCSAAVRWTPRRASATSLRCRALPARRPCSTPASTSPSAADSRRGPEASSPG